MSKKNTKAPKGLPADLAGDAVNSPAAADAALHSAAAPSAPSPGRVTPRAPARVPPPKVLLPAAGDDGRAEPAIPAKLAEPTKAKVAGFIRPTRAVPGLAVATDTAPPMADVEQMHAAEVCPELFPRESPNRPGVFLDPETGAPCLPPLTNQPQYSALLLEIRNTLDPGSPGRGVVVPVHTPPTAYPRLPHEQVARRVEGVFDDERMRNKYLARHGVDPIRDPLRTQSNAASFGVNPFGEGSPIPGHLGPRIPDPAAA